MGIELELDAINAIDEITKDIRVRLRQRSQVIAAAKSQEPQPYVKRGHVIEAAEEMFGSEEWW